MPALERTMPDPAPEPRRDEPPTTNEDDLARQVMRAIERGGSSLRQSEDGDPRRASLERARTRELAEEEVRRRESGQNDEMLRRAAMLREREEREEREREERGDRGDYADSDEWTSDIDAPVGPATQDVIVRVQGSQGVRPPRDSVLLAIRTSRRLYSACHQLAQVIAERDGTPGWQEGDVITTQNTVDVARPPYGARIESALDLCGFMLQRLGSGE